MKHVLRTDSKHKFIQYAYTEYMERKGMFMCAIAGVINLQISTQVKDSMLQTMRNRGPDEEDVYREDGCLLLHSRLTIIDPAGGKQPMQITHNGKKYTIVYNGELYNTEELRRELQTLGHHFVGHSDTEVMLHAYAQWGEAVLAKVNGIFGFAVWESTTRALFMARDRMGVKPLFYTIHNGGMIFASEIKTLLSYPGVEPQLDSNGAAELLLLGPGRTPGSGVFKNIYELVPGCCGAYIGGKWRWKRYWKLVDRIHAESFDETVEQVRYLVTDSIKRQMISDFPVGTFLSGGLDSSLISAICARKMSDDGAVLKTFSVDYKDNDLYFVPEKFQPSSDNYYIDLMRRYLGSEHHRTVLSPEELIGAMESATCARDLPGMADVDFSLLCFCKKIRQHVKVALSGECADEIFGGYPWYRDPAIRDVDGFPWAQNTKYRQAFLSDWIRDSVNAKDFVRDRYNETIQGCDILPENTPLERRMKQMVNLNQQWFMQTLLDRKDRMSMYCGLEVRVPFCDYRIAEYMYAVPWEYKDYQNREKGLLRYAMEGILPEDVLYRKKSPYPKTYDPHYLELVQYRLRQILEEQDAPIYTIVKKEALEGLLTAEYAWPWYGQLMRVPQTIAYMLQLNSWLKMYKVQIV